MNQKWGHISLACLAAGSSSRMQGEHKLQRFVGDRRVIEMVCEELLYLPFAESFFVLGHQHEMMQGQLGKYNFSIRMNSDYKSGMHSSIRVAVHAAQECEALVLCLADQPFLLRKRVEAILQIPVDSSTLRCSYVQDQPGHPVVIGRDYFAHILAHEDGEFGCSYLFRDYADRCEKVEQDESALWDLDTPEDFNRYVPEHLARLSNFSGLQKEAAPSP